MTKIEGPDARFEFLRQNQALKSGLLILSLKVGNISDVIFILRSNTLLGNNLSLRDRIYLESWIVFMMFFTIMRSELFSFFQS